MRLPARIFSKIHYGVIGQIGQIGQIGRIKYPWLTQIVSRDA
jgi:hypothetical protein